jgi:DNA polymerase III subunit delta'
MVSAAFAPLIGQSQAVELLTQAIDRDRIAPAYLFVGPEGVGRKLAAHAFLEALLSQSSSSAKLNRQQSNHPDILWVEPTYQHQGKPMTAAALVEKGISLPKGRPQVRLEQIRDITRFLSQAPMESPRSLVIIEGAQTMGESAANGLLKTLEEPGHGTLILIAPSVESLLPTIVSRCQKIPFHPLSTTDLTTVLQRLDCHDLLQEEQLIKMAQGSPGLAIQYWEKRQAMPIEVIQACQTLPQNARGALELARQIEKALEMDLQLWLLDYLQQQYWLSHGNPEILKPLELAKTYLTNYAQPQLVWEVTLLKLAELRV